MYTRTTYTISGALKNTCIVLPLLCLPAGWYLFAVLSLSAPTLLCARQGCTFAWRSAIAHLDGAVRRAASGATRSCWRADVVFACAMNRFVTFRCGCADGSFVLVIVFVAQNYSLIEQISL